VAELPPAREDELRLDHPAGTVTIRVKDRPIIRCRRPLIRELRRLLERYEEIQGEYFDISVVEFVDPLNPARGTRHPMRDGATFVVAQTSIGPRWLSEVVETLTDGAVVVDPDDWPGWVTKSQKIFNDLTGHWFEVPLAFGASETGWQPNESAAVNPNRPEPTLLAQAIPDGPVPG
jgi:hypothetical protein